ncbi:hypothetical protein BDV23DRAFT_95028 [Aspergillus alliaceus]|uniref:Uncharacterized protein n=1 Tax=Petromyces alliaceus TaxID=209559 RepID=A0A5N7CMR4_PETAA|nr:hypothetical protein BDV23DRAFT_95028 [Aspergillus alliaceus]
MQVTGQPRRNRSCSIPSGAHVAVMNGSLHGILWAIKSHHAFDRKLSPVYI